MALPHFTHNLHVFIQLETEKKEAFKEIEEEVEHILFFNNNTLP